MKLTCYALKPDPPTIHPAMTLVFPIPHGVLQSVEPEIVDLDDEPELQAQTMAWKEHRDEFMRKFNAKDR